MNMFTRALSLLTHSWTSKFLQVFNGTTGHSKQWSVTTRSQSILYILVYKSNPIFEAKIDTFMKNRFFSIVFMD